MSRFLAEDRSQKSLFRCRFDFTFRRDLTYKDHTRFHIGTKLDDSALIKMKQFIFTDIGDISCDLLRSVLKFPCLYLFLIDVNRCKGIFTDDLLGNDDRILVVVSIPRHKSNHNVLTDSKLTLIHIRTICDHLFRLYLISHFYDRCLRKGGVLVGSHVLFHRIMVYKHTCFIFTHDINAFRIYFFNCTCSFGFDSFPCIT